MNLDKERIGRRVKVIRLELGETTEVFGQRFSPVANRGLVSNWESGRYLPNNERLKAIADIGNITVEELLHGDSLDDKPVLPIHVADWVGLVGENNYIKKVIMLWVEKSPSDVYYWMMADKENNEKKLLKAMKNGFCVEKQSV